MTSAAHAHHDQHHHPTPSARAALAAALADIKLAHSVFALPFALLAAFLAAPTPAPDHPPELAPLALPLALVVAAMVAARTWAMLVNRIADAPFDARNPRTARRALPAGRVPRPFALALAAASALAFTICCALFWILLRNPWPLILSAPVLAWIALYSFTKRFTALAHLFLGGALAVSPIAAAIALNPGLVFTTNPPPPALAVYAIAGFVLLWVAGFDVIYALQDLDFDRHAGLRSIPAALGWRGAAWTARALHAAALLCLLLAAARTDPRLGTLFTAAAAATAAMLALEHAVLARRGLQGLPLAFFTINGVVAIAIGAAGIADLFL